MRHLAFVALIALVACGGCSRPELASEARCHQANDHFDQLTDQQAAGSGSQAAARLQSIQQARAAGIVANEKTDFCTGHWTNAVVDCVLAASDSATAKACIPAT